MIRFVDELVEELNGLKKTPMMGIKVNGAFDIDSVELVKDNISINISAYCSHEDLDDEISELQSNLDDTEAELDGCKDALNLVCDSIDEIQQNINEYKKFHIEEWKVLSQLDMNSLEEFVKIAIDWYNIKDEVESEC